MARRKVTQEDMVPPTTKKQSPDEAAVKVKKSQTAKPAVVQEEEEEYNGISAMADRLDIDEAACSRWLRSNGVEKVDGRYRWTDEELDEIVSMYEENPPKRGGRPKKEEVELPAFA